MSDFKEEMIQAVESGYTTEADSYEYVRESYASAYDDWHTRAKEAGYRNPLVAPMFCQTCHYNESPHPRPECPTGFIPGDVEAAHIHNEKIGFPSRHITEESKP